MITPNHSEKQQDTTRRSYDNTLLLVALLLFALTCYHLFFYGYQHDRHRMTLPADLLHAPPELVAYQQTAVFTLPLTGTPVCFAVREDMLIIGADTPPALWFFDADGTLLRKIDLLEEPRAVVCGTAETIFSDKIVVAHPASITVYTAEGQLGTSWKLPGEESNLRSLALTPDYLFAADTSKRSVHRFSEYGDLDLTFGDFTVYASPIVLTYSPQTGSLYIANPGKHRVEVFTQNGEYQPELSWGEPSTGYLGFAGCCNPIGLAVLDDGGILTVEKAISRMKIFHNGGFDSIVAGPGILDSLPPGMMRQSPLTPDRYFAAAVLSEGRIAVFDFEYAAVRIFVLEYRRKTLNVDTPRTAVCPCRACQNE